MYYTTCNFIGAHIDGCESPYALLTRETADALRTASEDAYRLGYRFEIYDAYRPQSAVDHFVCWAQDANAQKNEGVFFLYLAKAELLRQGCIARPSAHSRGSAVDLTLLGMKTGCECWHFTLTDESYPDAAFTFPIRPR